MSKDSLQPDPEKGGNGEDSELRQRIRSLERELVATQEARKQAEDELDKERSAGGTSTNASRSHLNVQSLSSAGSGGLRHADSNSHHVLENVRHYGRTDGVIFIEPETAPPIEQCAEQIPRLRGIYKLIAKFVVKYNIDRFVHKPVLHQWFENGKVVREAIQRESSKFELFFDLLFIGIVHQISDATAEEPNGVGFARYVLTFCPAYSVWTDVRELMNQFGTDDGTQRIYLLWTMLLLVGYASNASSITFNSAIESAGGEGVQEAVGIGAELVTEIVSGVSQRAAIQWTLGFFSVAKLTKALMDLAYSCFVPKVQLALWSHALNAGILALLALIAIFLSLNGQMAMAAVIVFLDLFLRTLAVLTVKAIETSGRRYRKKRTTTLDSESTFSYNTSGSVQIVVGNESGSGSATPDLEKSEEQVAEKTTGFMAFVHRELDLGKKLRVPAINIEHHVDRLGAFVTIVLGEMVANILFKNSLPSALSRESGRSFLALMLAFNLNWIYFDSEGCREFIHALRRHWITAALFTHLHLPLVMSLLLASSAINRLVIQEDVSVGLKFFFGTGIGVGIICMGASGMLHKQLDAGRMWLPFCRDLIFTVRYILGMLMVLLPFAHARLDSMGYLAIYVGLTAFIVVEEVFMRVEERECGPQIMEATTFG